MGIFNKKANRNKNEFDFVKQYLTKMSTRENLSMFEELLDAEDTVGKAIDTKLRKKLGSTFMASLKAVDIQVKEYFRLCEYLNVLKKRQNKRRNKMYDWLDAFCDDLDAKEEKKFIEKYCQNIDLECMSELFSRKYDKKSRFLSVREFFEENNSDNTSSDANIVNNQEPQEVSLFTPMGSVEEQNVQSEVDCTILDSNVDDFEPEDDMEGDEIEDLMRQ